MGNVVIQFRCSFGGSSVCDTSGFEICKELDRRTKEQNGQDQYQTVLGESISRCDPGSGIGISAVQLQ